MHQIEKPLHSQRNNRWTQSAERKKIFASYSFNGGLIHRVHKEEKRLGSKISIIQSVNERELKQTLFKWNAWKMFRAFSPQRNAKPELHQDSISSTSECLSSRYRKQQMLITTQEPLYTTSKKMSVATVETRMLVPRAEVPHITASIFKKPNSAHRDVPSYLCLLWHYSRTRLWNKPQCLSMYLWWQKGMPRSMLSSSAIWGSSLDHWWILTKVKLDPWLQSKEEFGDEAVWSRVSVY